MLRTELRPLNESALRSLDEGLEETLTLHRLGVSAPLRQRLATTNMLESVYSLVEQRTRRVDRRSNSNQKQRWLAAALLELEPRLRRVREYRAYRTCACRSSRRVVRETGNVGGHAPVETCPGLLTVGRLPRLKGSIRISPPCRQINPGHSTLLFLRTSITCVQVFEGCGLMPAYYINSGVTGSAPARPGPPCVSVHRQRSWLSQAELRCNRGWRGDDGRATKRAGRAAALRRLRSRRASDHLNLLAPNVEWWYHGPSEIPFAGQRRDREQVAQFFQTVGGMVDVEQFGTLGDFIVQGNKVVVHGHERVRVKANGRTWDTQ